MKVRLERERCIASGGCVFASPEVFDQDDDGIVYLIHPDPPEELRESVLAAIDACPAAVISLED